MHNEIELSFGNVLIILLALAMTWWAARAPKSFVKLLSARFPGLDKDRPWVNSVVKWWGRITFFMCLSAFLLVISPASLQTPGFSLVAEAVALGIAIVALRKPRKEENPSAIG